ncbi:MAG: DUF2207 domain-containing protein [Arachnia sp.]
MSPIDIGFVAIAVLVSGVLFTVGSLARLFFRDRIFQGLTPGLVPAPGQTAAIGKVGPGREYSGEVAVAFSPPRGLRPGLVGTVVDGVAEMRDITATIVDLSVRGHLKLHAVGTSKKDRDWEVTLREDKPTDRLDHFEVQLLQSMFGPQLLAPATVRLKDWAKRRREDVIRLRDDLYRQTVENKWYARNPHDTSLGCLRVLGFAVLLAWCVISLIISFGVPTILSSLLLIAAAWFASKRLKRREPRTAVGTAVMIQSLGFKKYLATAEAAQFKVEEAAGIFSRYLPYALVFGVADHWAKVFGGIVDYDESIDAFDWIDLGADLSFGVDAIFDTGLLDGRLIDIGDAFEGVAGLVEGVGDFISSLDF